MTSDLEFSPPSASPAIDADAILAAVPADTMIKRLFVDIALSQLRPQLTPVQVLESVGVTLRECGQFENVPWHDYFRVALFVAATTHGPEQVGAGLRAVGRSFYPVVVRTPAGKLMLGKQLGEGLRNVADTWQQFNTLGRVWSQFINDREFDYHFQDYPSGVAESVGVGVFEGVFKYHHMPVDITIARPDARRVALRMGW